MSSSSDCRPDTGDTTWVLISTVLVLGMMPGLAFFEAGLLRAKNTISIMTQTMCGLITLSTMWSVIGYSLVFGDSLGGVIGNPATYPLLLGLKLDDCLSETNRISTLSYAVFMMMFACITPLLITGAVAERLKFKSFFVFTIAWELFVYYPLAHWIWGNGWLHRTGLTALDFAGGIVIHTSAGAGALVMALMLGQRDNFDMYHGEFPPSNLTLAGIGAAFLWIGWFGFNAGSALAAGITATSAVVSTQLACATSGLFWMILSWSTSSDADRKVPKFVATINGVIAGLAGVTPASGYISSQPSLALGVILGLASYGSMYLLKHKLRIDDALDVSSVHGVTGAVGSIAIGFLATKVDNPALGDDQLGLFYSPYSPHQLWVQLLAVTVSACYSAVVTFLIAFCVNKVLGLRITLEQERVGLDKTEHAESSYNHQEQDSHLLSINH